jgi:hypothetical protein
LDPPGEISCVASLSKTTVIPRERTNAVENLLDAKRDRETKRNERRKQEERKG